MRGGWGGGRVGNQQVIPAARPPRTVSVRGRWHERRSASIALSQPGWQQPGCFVSIAHAAYWRHNGGRDWREPTADRLNKRRSAIVQDGLRGGQPRASQRRHYYAAGPQAYRRARKDADRQRRWPRRDVPGGV